MGWWQTNREGASFSSDPDGPELLWGDGPADVMDDALLAIREQFREQCGREPSMTELRAGLSFSTNVLLDNGELTELPSANSGN